jgi:DNA-binding NarL/FixJ family response regulator
MEFLSLEGNHMAVQNRRVVVSKIRAAIVDDHPIVAEGARALIEASNDIECAGVANSVAEGLQLVARTEPDVLILDVSLPDGDGLELARQIIGGGHRCHIVMMTLFDDRKYVDEAIRIGAKGFVQKRAAGQNLLLAIRTAMLGGLFLDPLSASASASQSEHVNDEASDLTDREREVLRMIALGFSNKEVAHKVDVSIKSVETYKSRATEKLKLFSRAQIVNFAIRNGWMTLPRENA